MPPAFKRLSRTAQVILLLLVALAISEYAIMYQQYSQTKQNFKLIEQSFIRTSELFRVAFDARTMVLLNQNMQSNYYGFTNLTSFTGFLTSDLTKSLSTIYTIQNEINLSQLPLSDDLDQLLNNKTVSLYFKQDSGTKMLKFSLTESILQMSSTIFTVSNIPLAQFNESNEDVFFLIYNSFNDFMLSEYYASQMYTQALMDRSDEKKETGMILYIIAISALVLAKFILIPVVHSVNKQKDKVLSLFCEIDNSCIKVLSLRCERFITNLSAEEGNDDIDSTEDLEANI